MLKGISPLISPELLYTLTRMGHGDEIILADAHFPGESCNTRVIRADGLLIASLLEAILPLFELDSYVEWECPLVMMAPVPGDTLDPEVEKSYIKAVQITNPDIVAVEKIERFAFYERTRDAFAVVMTGDTAKYGNILLKKGVSPG